MKEQWEGLWPEASGHIPSKVKLFSMASFLGTIFYIHYSYLDGLFQLLNNQSSMEWLLITRNDFKMRLGR